MSYQLQEQYTSKNQVPGSAADSVWHRGARKVSSITVHHWGLKGQQFDTVRDFLCTNNSPTSAHYVAQDGLVACIVSPDDCAFHAGNAEGNTNSIGIECRPEATDGDYATVAELIRNLRAIYGDIPLHPHNYWYATACPGDYDLDRLDRLARGAGQGIAAQGTITQTEQPKEWDEMASIEEFKQAIKDVLHEGPAARDIGYYNWVETPLPGWNGNVSAAARVAGTDQAVNDIRALVAAQNAQIAGLVGALASINKGEPFDQDKLLAGVQSAAETGVKDAIESITVTVKES